MYNIGYIFYENDKDYTAIANYCNQNNLSIVEIEADENGKRFTIVENKLTDVELMRIELLQLKDWYNTEYTKEEQKLRRLHTLRLLTDEGYNPYDELINLYSEAEIKRARIQELERLLSDSSK